MSVYLIDTIPTSAPKRHAADDAGPTSVPSIFRGRATPGVSIIRYYERPDGCMWAENVPGLPLEAVDRIGGSRVDYRAPRPTESDPSLVLVAAWLVSWHPGEGRYVTEMLRFGPEHTDEEEGDE